MCPPPPSQTTSSQASAAKSTWYWDHCTGTKLKATDHSNPHMHSLLLLLMNLTKLYPFAVDNGGGGGM